MNIRDLFRKSTEHKFLNASEAYQMARYNDKLTRDQVKNRILDQLKSNITRSSKVSGKFLDITTYSGPREKVLLPEIATYFRELGYHVDLLCEDKYQDVNVLIINWQGLETDNKKS